MDNEFLKIVSSPLMNLDHTYRYSGTKLVESESLSQHIIDTIMMGLKIIDECNHRIESNSLGRLDPAIYVLKATYHDLEEAITGDVPRPLKYHDEDTLSSMRAVADKVAMNLFKDQFHDSEEHYWMWENAKEDPEGYILKVVDTLVVVNKVIKEVSFLHNYYMLKVAHEVSQYLKELLSCIEKNNILVLEIRLYLIDLINDAFDAMNDILEENHAILEKFHFSDQSMI